MAALVQTQECYPVALNLPGLPDMSAPEPGHAACSGGHTIDGLLGGWVCPCPCHHAPDPTLDPTRYVCDLCWEEFATFEALQGHIAEERALTRVVGESE